MKKSFGVVHAIGQCQDCEWEASGYKNAQAISAIHARKYKHKVHVEVGIGGYYDGKK